MAQHLQQIIFKLTAKELMSFLQKNDPEGDVYFSFGVDQDQRMGINIIFSDPSDVEKSDASEQVVIACPYPPGCRPKGNK
jgi:hypothetical protein